jgi:hypothetical protein
MTKAGWIVLSVVGIIIGIVSLMWYIGVSNQHEYNERMIDADCFPLGVYWDEQK